MSGLARRIKKRGADLEEIKTCFPGLREHAQRLAKEPDRLAIDDDLVMLSALRDVMVSGKVDIEFPEAVKLIATIITTKTKALRVKHAEAMRDAVPVKVFEGYVEDVVRLFRAFVPRERHPELLREFQRLAARRCPTPTRG